MNSYKYLPPLSILLFFIACENSPIMMQNQAKTPSTINKEVKEIKYIDGGVVIPNPRIRNISINLNDSAHAILTYIEYTENKGNDTTKNTIKINTDRVSELYDNMVQLSDIPDGMEITPGKVPCVGKRGIDVAIIFNTGDTSRFKISGGALCDRDVIPEWKLIDSLTSVIYSESLVKQ
jgi:hypothetical protein